MKATDSRKENNFPKEPAFSIRFQKSIPNAEFPERCSEVRTPGLDGEGPFEEVGSVSSEFQQLSQTSINKNQSKCVRGLILQTKQTQLCEAVHHRRMIRRSCEFQVVTEEQMVMEAIRLLREGYLIWIGELQTKRTEHFERNGDRKRC
jgi:hypothetical protein